MDEGSQPCALQSSLKAEPGVRSRGQGSGAAAAAGPHSVQQHLHLLRCDKPATKGEPGRQWELSQEWSDTSPSGTYLSSSLHIF